MNYKQVCQIKREVERARTGERDGQTDRQRVRERRRYKKRVMQTGKERQLELESEQEIVSRR